MVLVSKIQFVVAVTYIDILVSIEYIISHTRIRVVPMLHYVQSRIDMGCSISTIETI